MALAFHPLCGARSTAFFTYPNGHSHCHHRHLTLPLPLANRLVGLRRVVALARPYFSSDERWRARGLLAAIVTL
ncbi:MAG: hypothetical protein U1D28_15150, partial [Burkholderiales bacterium]|nr:hypothetical protein [Burkholderiales bacterium]